MHLVYTRGKYRKGNYYKDGVPINAIAYSSNGQTSKKTIRYAAVEMPVQEFYLNSISNETWRGGRSKTILPVELPEGTVEWYYEFTASRNKAIQKANVDQFSLASQLTSLVDNTGILSASVNMLTAPPGGDVCNLYLIDGQFYNPFLSGKEFEHYSTGSRQNFKSGIVQVRGLKINRPMIGIKNPDGYYGINVSLKIVAIVSRLE